MNERRESVIRSSEVLISQICVDWRSRCRFWQMRAFTSTHEFTLKFSINFTANMNRGSTYHVKVSSSSDVVNIVTHLRFEVSITTTFFYFIKVSKYITSTLYWPGPRRTLRSVESFRALETYLQCRLLSTVISSRSDSVEVAIQKFDLWTSFSSLIGGGNESGDNIWRSQKLEGAGSNS